jgi:hypothetical protein
MSHYLLKISLLFVGSLLLLTSCGPRLSPFTQRLYEDQRWTEQDLERIQFYLSEDIVLTRELRGGSSDIIRGEIKVVDGREVEQLVIRRKTPGVFLFSPREERFAIAFEDGGSDRFLIFGPNPRAGGRYTLRASDWNRTSGTVTYDGRKWRVSSADAFAALMVDMKRIRNQNVRSRVAGGRRIE